MLRLGYDSDYIDKHGILLTGNNRPSTADGKKVDEVYEIKVKYKKKFLKNTGSTRFLELVGIQAYIVKYYKDKSANVGDLTLKFINEHEVDEVLQVYDDIADHKLIPSQDDDFSLSDLF